MNTIQRRLFIAFLTITVLGVGSVSLFVLPTVSREIREYDSLADDLEMTRIRHWLSGYYRMHESWVDVQPYLDEIDTLYGRRVVITNLDGLIVADTRVDRGRPEIDGTWRSEVLGFPVSPSIGTVHVNQETSIADTLRIRMAGSIRRYILWGAALATAMSIGASVVISRPLARPIRSFARAAERVATGDFSVRVPASGVEELRALSETFNDMIVDLDAAVTLRKHLVADVAHELRTPLSNIRGYLEGRVDRVVSDELCFSVIQEEVALLIRLVEDLQDIALADVGAIEVNKEVTDLRDVVGEVVRNLDQRATQKDVTLDHRSYDSPVRVYVDSMRLGQALANLVSNALIHSPPGSQITITEEIRGKTAAVSVRDSGPGIEESQLSRIFERFYRTDSSRSRETGGHGLGLPIARYLVEAHDGTLRVESTVGRGSCFTVSLPRVASASKGRSESRSQALP